MLTERGFDLWQHVKRARYAVLPEKPDINALAVDLDALPEGEDLQLWHRSRGLTWTYNPQLPKFPGRYIVWLKRYTLTHQLPELEQRTRRAFPDPKQLVGRRFWETDTGETGQITAHRYHHTFSITFDDGGMASGFIDANYALDQELLPIQH